MKKSTENKLKLADKTFKTWRSTDFAVRQKLVKKLAILLRENQENLAKIITKEMNKPISQSLAEIEKCAWMCDFYAEAPNVFKPDKIKTENKISEIRYVPQGVILGIMPWNFPFWQALRFIVPAILAGNAAVLKHASICFGTGNAIEKLFIEAGFPKGVFQNLKVDHAAIKEILEHPTVKAVSLTGSGKAGAEVASIAGKAIKKSLLELGGNDAFIVLDDADLKEAASKAVEARLQNCGQACNAGKRFIIQKNVEKKFLPKFIEEYKTWKPGNKNKKDTKIAGMARPDLADELEKQYKKAIKNGAKILVPLKRLTENTFLPGLILVKKGNIILEEELFGPLGIVMIGKTDTEILSLANNIPFGLGNSVWTKDKKRQNFFIDNLESGMVSLNKVTSSDPRLPFGGTKASGYGTELSLLALREFTTAKTIVGNP